MNQPRILIWDVENAPILGHVWKMWDANVLDIVQDWYLLSYAWKWQNEKTTHVKGLCDFKGYKSGNDCEEKLVKGLWKLFDEADILIGHNIRGFDIKKAKLKFLEYGLKPYSPVKSIDTLTEARKFGFSSKKLDEVGKVLGVGRKTPHSGMSLWLKCMDGDLKAWSTMKKYNKQDVVLNSDVFDKLNPWRESGVNMGLHTADETPSCPSCGSEDITRRGFATTNAGHYLRFQCKDCGKYSRTRTKIKNSGNLLTHG